MHTNECVCVIYIQAKKEELNEPHAVTSQLKKYQFFFAYIGLYIPLLYCSFFLKYPVHLIFKCDA